MTTEYNYAVGIATYMWKKYYKEISPKWEPLEDTLGVLTQIDNMIAGMDQTAASEEVPYIGKTQNND